MKTVNIKYGYDYHIKSVEGGFIIEYTDGTNLYKQSYINNVLSNPEIISYCQEKISLVGGKEFIKTRLDGKIK